MEAGMLAAPETLCCRAPVHRQGWRHLILYLTTLVSMTTAYPTSDGTLSSTLTKQSLTQMSHYRVTSSALTYSSFNDLKQPANDFGTNFTEINKASMTYYDLVNTPSLSDTTSSPEALVSLEAESVYLNISPTPLIRTELLFTKGTLFPKPEVHSESAASLTTTMLNPSHMISFQNDVQANDHLLSPSYVIFGSHYATLSSVEPTMEPPENFFPTNTMDADYGSGDYLHTLSYMGTEEDDYSLLTNLPSDMYDFESSNSESYDTSFPTRLMIPLSTTHLTTAFSSISTSFGVTSTVPSIQISTLLSVMSSKPTVLFGSPLFISTMSNLHPTAVLPSVSTSVHYSSLTNQTSESESEWPGNVNIEPNEVLLPDMNSLEYYTIQLEKENESLPEQRGNQTNSKFLSVSTVETQTLHLSHMLTVTYDDLQPMDNSWANESSTDISGLDLLNGTISDPPELRPTLTNGTSYVLNSSDLVPPSVDISTSLWASSSTSDWINSETVSVSVMSNATEEPDLTSRHVTDIHWFINSTVSFPTDLTSNSTGFFQVTEMADQGLTETQPEEPYSQPSDDGTTAFSKPATTSAPLVPNQTAIMTPSVIKTEAFSVTVPPAVISEQTSTLQTSTAREYLCSITTKQESYLVRVGFLPGSTAGYAKAKVREILRTVFNRSVELQVVKAPPDFVFRAVSGPVVYTAISVMNALRRSVHTSESILSVSSISPVPDLQYHVHSVLQFVPSHVDIHVCTFIDLMEKGLTFAFTEVRRRSEDSADFTVQILNITTSSGTQTLRQTRGPVDIVFVMRDAEGFIQGSEVSSLLRQLSVVEFSYYLGFPVQQIAEPFHYPELNMSQLLRFSWVRTVLLGVMEHRMGDRIFKAKMERRLAVLLAEGLVKGRRSKRATIIGNNSLQIVQTARLAGSDLPLEIIYFVDGADGERLPAVTTVNLLNRVDVQHAAIILGYRILGVLAQPVEKQVSVPSEPENANMWIVVGVVVPVLVVVIIVSILYWKLCRTDKLEFQPDSTSSVQQRQKFTNSTQKPSQGSLTPVQRPRRVVVESSEEEEGEGEEGEEEEEEDDEEEEEENEENELQAPSVKGFDFAKLHLGQHSKDDLMVIQEPAPAPTKEPSGTENMEPSTPKSRGSSTKASRTTQHKRGQISPSDGDSVGSEPFSDRESPKENSRQSGTSSDPKQPRKMTTNGLNGPPPLNGKDEMLSSASIFEHVDRMSRLSADAANKRFSSKIQLIAMQPMPALPLPSTAITNKDPEGISKEIQVALRQKSEIEHHRNKIRLRAKRKGHYDFPAMDDLMDSLGDPKEHDHIYQKAQMQITKILDPDSHPPPLYSQEPKKSREKRSPRLRKKQINGDLTDADRDRLLTTDSDGTYKKYPGVNNIAFVSDPDQSPDLHSPSPSDDVFLSSASPAVGHIAPPPPYLHPQPSIEEARQQMHSLLDDAFALVSPSSQGPNAEITLPGLGVQEEHTSPSSPPSRGPRPCGPSYPALSPFSGRYPEVCLPPLHTAHAVLQRQGLGSGYVPADGIGGDRLQSEVLYSSRAGYMDDLPSSVRPRPVGGAAGAQLHHLSQVTMSGHAGEGRQPSALNWGPYPEDDFRPPNRDPVFHYPPISVFQNSRNGVREPSAPPAHVDSVGSGLSVFSPAEDAVPPSHSSASLIKAIREELMRLSQKQVPPAGYQS